MTAAGATGAATEPTQRGMATQRGTATRRQATLGGLALAAAGCVSACTSGTPAPGPSSATQGRPSASVPVSVGAASVRSAASGTVLSTLAGLPEGGVVVVDGPGGRPVVVVRPAGAEPVAFSAVCTHAGCTVAPAGGLVLRCPCHGSTFDAATGRNTGGPAPAPLVRLPVRIENGAVVVR